MSDDVLKAIIAAVASIVGAWFLYKGAQKTTASARAGSEQASAVTERAEVLDAWKELVDLLRLEVRNVRQDMTEMRNEHAAALAADMSATSSAYTSLVISPERLVCPPTTRITLCVGRYVAVWPQRFEGGASATLDSVPLAVSKTMVRAGASSGTP